MIPYNIPAYTGKEEYYISEAIKNHKVCGDGIFTARCSEWLKNKTGTYKALLTTSCTHALEMAAVLCNISEGDEIIMPSFTFVSTANAFVMRGAKIIFVDIRPDTLNINENLIESAITSRTRAIVPVHYAGISCNMDVIMDIAKRHNLYVIEDAAQGIMSSYCSNFTNKALGSMGDIGCFSFHETKNLTMGEGGAILLNNDIFIERAEIIREKGTNRSKFWRGEVDKYTWIDIGSSYLPSEINAAFLYAQLQDADVIIKNRMQRWNYYYTGLQQLSEKEIIELPVVPDNCSHNAHIFYIKVKNLESRMRLLNHLKSNDINAVFHYIPLHSSPAGKQYGIFHGIDHFTTRESERLIRLPLYYNMALDDVDKVIKAITSFKGVNN